MYFLDKRHLMPSNRLLSTNVRAVAKLLGRSYIGIERDAGYIAGARARIAISEMRKIGIEMTQAGEMTRPCVAECNDEWRKLVVAMIEHRPASARHVLADGNVTK